MNAHSLAVLEFPAVLALVAERAATEPGAARVRQLEPSADRDWVAAEQRRVAAVRAVSAGADGWRPEPVPAIAASLARLRAVGSTWSGEELLFGAVLLRSSRRTRDALRDGGPERSPVAAAVLAVYVEPLVAARAVEESIEHSIADDGTVKDDASPALRRIRRELRGAQSELVQLLERAMARLDPHARVSDMSVTVRNGRYVIPVRREARAAVGGIVHDESATKGTIFVEPPAAIEFGNHIRELEADEQREVDRVLLALTDAVRPLRAGMEASLESLIALDALYARARYADAFGCVPPAIGESGDALRITNGRHPLLLARADTVVPFDLSLSADEHTLLVSGPNTGGKSVLLKAIGLLAAMTQAGIPAPMGAESEMPMFDDIFADIGDEQSIAASLSTFSAHMGNLGDVLARATRASLVLVDELGSGTDPAEGAALGGAVLETLTHRGTRTVATTHLGTLKLLAAEMPGVVNASLQFDEQRLEPTYRLIKGIPGRSYGLAIARRLALPGDVLARAEERSSHQERDLSVLLADLERREVALAEREARTVDALAAANERLDRLTERERVVRETERTQERRARQQARQYLLDARHELERAIREVRDRAADDTAARDARRRLEELAARHGTEVDALDERPASPAQRAAGDVAPGDTVEVPTLGGRAGQVIELRGDDALVAVGAIKLTVPRRTLVRASPDSAPSVTISLRGDLPEEHVASEIDVRGMRVDEMERAVLQALDAAVRADLGSLRIIHGKGTGALRERVGELLRGDPRVRACRLGAWNEGGVGVTVAALQ